MGFVHSFGGLDGLLVLTVSLIAFLYAYLALRILHSGMNLMLGSLILAVSLAAVSHNLHVRPHILTILLMAVMFAKLCDIDMKRTDYRSLVWLVPFFLIWVNIHGGALGGLFTLIITVTGWTVAWIFCIKNPIQNLKWIYGLWTIVCLCVSSFFLNPYFLALPLSWLEIMGSKATAELIQEHASVLILLRHGDPKSFITVSIVLCLAVFYFVLLIGTERKERRVTWYIPLIWLIFSFSRIRHAPLFSVMAVIAIAEIFPYCRWVKSLGKKGLITFQIRNKDVATEKQSRLGYIIPALIFGIALLACQGSANLTSTTQKWVKLDPTHWPVDILPELKSIEKELPPGTPIFNDMLFGGFLIYHNPGFRVFIDDRCELYGDDFILRYVKAERSDLEVWQKQFPFQITLLKIDSNYRKFFDDDPNWLVVKRCQSAVLYRKILISNLSIRNADHDAFGPPHKSAAS